MKVNSKNIKEIIREVDKNIRNSFVCDNDGCNNSPNYFLPSNEKFCVDCLLKLLK